MWASYTAMYVASIYYGQPLLFMCIRAGKSRMYLGLAVLVIVAVVWSTVALIPYVYVGSDYEYDYYTLGVKLYSLSLIHI